MASAAEPKSNPAIEMIRLIRQEILTRLRKGELRYQRDRKTLVHHLTLAEEIGDALLVGQLQEMLGLVDSEVGHFESAENHWRAAYQAYESINHRAGMSNALNSLGELYFQRDRLEEAQQTFYKARELAEDANDREGIVRVESNLGWWWLRHGDYQQAKICFALVVTVTELETWQHIYSLVTARRGMAEVLLAERSFNAAWREANEAESLAAGRQLKLLLGLTHLTKAHIAQLDPNTPGAEDYYFQLGWETLSDYGNPIMIAQTYLTEARYQQKIGQLNRAKDFILEAHDLYTQLELPNELKAIQAMLKELA